MKTMNYDEKRAAISAILTQALKDAIDRKGPDFEETLGTLMGICEAPKPVDESSIIRLDLECESVLHFSNCKKAELSITDHSEIKAAEASITINKTSEHSDFFLPGKRYKACIQHADE